MQRLFHRRPTARALHRAAIYRAGQGALAAAIRAFQRALTVREQLLGGDHPDTLSSRNSLAYAYGSAGDLGRATALYERTLADCERGRSLSRSPSSASGTAAPASD
ncbi:tetratricopeptide repeat protein [Streptomyces sp. NPDC005877]|uniref:tetratricopeptide repeat protein n=1 Tax=Streptomyces sp. NPDC005877 TaxID=3155346 RepID=UPI0033D84A91